MNPDRLHTIKLNWSYPRLVENVSNSEYASCHGIYLISRVFGGKESYIYVGKTERPFSQRLWEHQNKDFSSWTQKRGIWRVRFCDVHKEGFDDALLIDCIESAVIHSLIEKGINTLTNTSKVRSCTVHYPLRVISKGYRGAVPPSYLFIPD